MVIITCRDNIIIIIQIYFRLSWKADIKSMENDPDKEDKKDPFVDISSKDISDTSGKTDDEDYEDAFVEI